jgi:hypothetical protein
VRAAQGRVVLMSLKAAGEALSHPPFCRALLAQPGGEAALRTLLSLAVDPTSSGGLGNLNALQDAWLSGWSAWRAAFGPPGAQAAGAPAGPPPDAPPDKPGRGGSTAPSRASSEGMRSAGTSTAAAPSLAAFMQAVTGEGTAVSAAVSAPSPAEREAAIVQMMEMGFPREWCEAALRRCGNNVEVSEWVSE